MKTNDYKPKNAEEARVMEEMKAKNQTLKYTRWVFLGCFIVLGIAFIAETIARICGVTFEIASSPLLTAIVGLCTACLGYMFAKNQDK